MLSVVPRQGTRRAARQGRTVTVKCRLVPHSNFRSSQGNSLLGSNLRISNLHNSNGHHSNGRHKIMWGNLTPNNLDSTIHNPVGMGNRASSTSKLTPMYAIHTPARTVAVVSESLVRPGCARSCAARNSAVLDAWAGRWQCS